MKKWAWIIAISSITLTTILGGCGPDDGTAFSSITKAPPCTLHRSVVMPIAFENSTQNITVEVAIMSDACLPADREKSDKRLNDANSFVRNILLLRLSEMSAKQIRSRAGLESLQKNMTDDLNKLLRNSEKSPWTWRVLIQKVSVGRTDPFQLL
ncbi:MAG: flagellar basal body-associated FliL family protein [Phycisphaerae bacterium]|nr:flagellar basal body-associated FliL family protein [Phycisphaerae bacterium]